MQWIFGLCCLAASAAAQPPAIPVGADALRLWERWPYQRIGARAYMRSTYDRCGGNERTDASHLLYQEADDFNVTLKSTMTIGIYALTLQRRVALRNGTTNEHRSLPNCAITYPQTQG
ncbi:MAG: hypothetical protein LAQ69_32430 [Acidobacteriia bacterium]|nr:hypothetical protein [Terriglobia bacterium]